MTTCTSNRMFLHVTDEQEVLRVVNFEGKYSTDNDGIGMYIVKKVIFY